MKPKLLRSQATLMPIEMHEAFLREAKRRNVLPAVLLLELVKSMLIETEEGWPRE
jgi:hypothetical protein